MNIYTNWLELVVQLITSNETIDNQNKTKTLYMTENLVNYKLKRLNE